MANTKLTFIRYKSMREMTALTRARVSKMGHADKDYHLRHVANGTRDYQLRSALVLFKGTTPIGWAAYYYDKYMMEYHVSIWIIPSCRKKGYGFMLTKKAFALWNRYEPETHLRVELWWKQLINDGLAW